MLAPMPGKNELMKRSLAVALTLFTLLAGATMPARAQNFPSKSVRLVVPFPPGGPLDISGRLIAQHLQDRWGQLVVVENWPSSTISPEYALKSALPGAMPMPGTFGSTVGPEHVVKSARDGYTLLIISSTPLVTLPHLQKVPYDVLRDLVGVTQTTLLTYVLVVNANTGITSMQQLIDEARKAPGRFKYASAGNGTGQHLYMELLKSAANINLTHIPYKGAAAALQAVMAGEVPIMLEVAVAVVPLVKSGKARALMVTGSKPLEQFPGAIPFDTLFPGLGIPGWHGIFAPGGTPKPILDKLANDIRQVLQIPAVANRFRELGVEPSGVSGDRFNEIVRRDYARWGEIIRRNNLRAD
jgi:tripartite-type tricarboxylate transporter receptor subunit TctC